MLGNFFAKLALIFSAVAGLMLLDYIKVGTANLVFDYKTGGISPIYYYLYLQNIGDKKARFDIASDSQWIRAYREGSPTDMSVALTPTSALNIVIEIRPERENDGVTKGEVSIMARDLSDYGNTILDKEEVRITLNKNVVVASSVESPVAVSPSLSSGAIVSLTPLAEESVTPSASLAVAIATTTIKPVSGLRKTLVPSPTPSPAGTFFKTGLSLDKTPVFSPPPPTPDASRTVAEKSSGGLSFIKAIFSFIRSVFR